MNRFFQITSLSLLITGATFAGPVTVNLGTAGVGGASVLNKNLAANGYLPCSTGTDTNGDTCTTANTTVLQPPSGSAVGFSNVLFNSAQVPFNIASGGANSGTGAGDTSNIWAPGNSVGNQTKQINVGTYTTNSTGTSTSGNTSGLFGVDQIWTMLNDLDGVVGYQGISLTLNGFQADGTTPITETVDLTAGVDYRSIGGATLPLDPTSCDVANIGSATLGSTCVGHTSTTAKVSGTDTGFNSTNLSEGVTVTVFNNAFNTTDTLAHPNNYWLDVQDINLGGVFNNGWLNDIVITSKDGTNGTTEKAILSALTVDQIAAPEPATTALIGLGLAGIALLRRKHSKKV